MKKQTRILRSQAAVHIVLSVGSLAAIGVGLWFIYPPAAAVVVGGLVWIDLSRS
tara:strand:+ start:2607 stop:2768 length:162 start_codon:yes stop_codon:yes gene_type:complete